MASIVPGDFDGLSHLTVHTRNSEVSVKITPLNWYGSGAKINQRVSDAAWIQLQTTLLAITLYWYYNFESEELKSMLGVATA